MARVPIGSRKHRIVVCASKDIVESSDTVSIVRRGVFEGWAAIEMKRSSSFSREGFTIQQSSEYVTHYVTMNYRPDVDITNAAWLYEERRMSPPRWFKIIRYGELDERFWRFEVSLIEKSEDAPEPKAPRSEEEARFIPHDDGVEL